MFETALFLPLKVFYDYRLFYFIWPIFMMYFMYKSIMLDSLFVYILDTCVYFFQHLLSLETHSVLWKLHTFWTIQKSTLFCSYKTLSQKDIWNQIIL